MSPALRTVLAVIAGVAVGVILIMAGEALSPYQPAAGVDYTNSGPYSEWLQSLPDRAFGIMLATFLTASFTGGFVTAWLTPPTSFPPAFATGFILLLYTVATVLAFPNPAWMSYSTCIGCVALALLGGWLAKWIKHSMTIRR